jgi:hypothetical protein
MTQLETLEAKLHPLYTRLASHPLYASFRTIADLRTFMEAHVFAVWDFMSLLKALQRGLTCVEVPWFPSETPESRRLVNEIVLSEESDIYQGQHVSHFELYCMAMEQCGASTVAIDRLLFALRDGADLHEAIRGSRAPEEARGFVRDTFHVISEGKLHCIAAAFTFGREDLIPEMFKGFVRDLNRDLDGNLDTFLWYLERHIEVDGEEHGPMALRMIAELCGDDADRWREAEEAAIVALESRLRLWDGIAARIATNTSLVDPQLLHKGTIA